MNEKDFDSPLDREPSFGDPTNPDLGFEFSEAELEVLREEMRPEGSFRPGDKIKFYPVGAFEDGQAFLCKTGERIFLAVVVVEKNGKPLSEPCPLECGVYTDELPKGKEMFWKGEELWAGDDLIPGRLLTATLQDGLARFKPENAGKWVVMSGQVFIVGSTLAVTAEPVPPAQQAPKPAGKQYAA